MNQFGGNFFFATVSDRVLIFVGQVQAHPIFEKKFQNVILGETSALE